MRLLGCDPGANTGLILLEVPETWNILEATLLHAETIVSRTDPARPRADSDRDFLSRLRSAIARLRPHVAVVEDPSDAAPYWGAKARGGQQTARGSMYRLGVYKGLLFAALAGEVHAIAEYQVDGTKEKPGWMKADHGSRKVALVRMGALATHLRVHELGAGKHTEHVLMALGVLHHHCGRLQRAQLRATAQALPPYTVSCS